MRSISIKCLLLFMLVHWSTLLLSQIDSMTYLINESYSSLISHHLSTSDGGLLLAGAMSSGVDSELLFIRLDSTGQEIWSIIPNLEQVEGSSSIIEIEELSSGDFLVVGWSYSCGNGSGPGYYRISNTDGIREYVDSDFLDETIWNSDSNIHAYKDNVFCIEYQGYLFFLNDAYEIIDTLDIPSDFSINDYYIDTISNTVVYSNNAGLIIQDIEIGSYETFYRSGEPTILFNNGGFFELTNDSIFRCDISGIRLDSTALSSSLMYYQSRAIVDYNPLSETIYYLGEDGKIRGLGSSFDLVDQIHWPSGLVVSTLSNQTSHLSVSGWNSQYGYFKTMDKYSTFGSAQDIELIDAFIGSVHSNEYYCDTKNFSFNDIGVIIQNNSNHILNAVSLKMKNTSPCWYLCIELDDHFRFTFDDLNLSQGESDTLFINAEIAFTYASPDLESICVAVEPVHGYIDTITSNNTGCAIIPVHTNVEELSERLFSIFPNPAMDEIYLDAKLLKADAIRMYDILGNEYKVQLGVNDISNLESGTYYIELISNHKRLIQSIVKL